MTASGLVLVLGLTTMLLGAHVLVHSVSGPDLPGQGNTKVASSRVREQHQTPNAATSTTAPRPRPPRGYCVRISRAIKPNSVCYKHLVVASLGTSAAGADAHYEHQTTSSASRSSQGPASLAAPLSEGQATTTTTTTGKHRAKRFAPANWPTQRARHNHEELVYVRSETLGSEITNLSTQVINERLVRALLGQLIPRRGKDGLAAQGDANRMLAEVRLQIAGSSSPDANELLRAKKCQLGVEKLVCRLVYPTCHFRSLDAGALVRPPCREDCLLLRDELCPNLNWAKFAGALQQAINSTLMATINALDLLVDGDPPPPTLITGRAQSAAPASEISAHNNALEQKKLLDVNNADNRHHMSAARSGPTTDAESRRRRRRTASWPPGYNLSSSLHFYWPHEHSIDRCELLPPLRPLVPMEAAVGLARVSRDTAMTAASTRWILDHRTRANAICSNAHLTGLSMDEAQGASANTNTVPDNDRGHAAGTKKRDDIGSSSITNTNECLKTPNGADYKGTKNVTRSGLACQFWRDQYPHRHKSSELLFDIMRDSHNYCRNPGGLDANGPFCYTMDKDVRWEYCQIDRCNSNKQ